MVRNRAVSLVKIFLRPARSSRLFQAMKQLVSIVLAAALTACIVPTSSTDPYASSSAQVAGGVFVNGQRLAADQQAHLEQLVGEPIPAGRYVLEANGSFGFEGRSERVNLAAIIEARQQQRGAEGADGHNTVMTDGRGSTFVGYDDCVSMTTPSGTFMGSGC